MLDALATAFAGPGSSGGKIELQRDTGAAVVASNREWWTRLTRACLDGGLGISRRSFTRLLVDHGREADARRENDGLESTGCACDVATVRVQRPRRRA